MPIFDINKPFALSLVATAPSPATSGLTLTVTAGQGASFPSSPFLAPVCPPGVFPTRANSEIVLVTAIATDTFTITRIQEGTSARSIQVGDQIWAGLTLGNLLPAFHNSVCDGRLTLTTVTPVTTADVLAATTLFFTPYKGNRIALFNGTSWNWYTFAEISIAVPATTSQMYDVFAFDNAGTPALELLAWTNDSTRATLHVLQDGVKVKSGATTRRFVGCMRTTTVSGQTEDSGLKRYVWNINKARRSLLRQESTSSWTYTLATIRQANGSAANQVEVIIGLAESLLDLEIHATVSNTNAPVAAGVMIGEDSTTTPVAGQAQGFLQTPAANTLCALHASLHKYPAIGRHVYSWLEASVATGTATWTGAAGGFGSGNIGGLYGSIEG